jgi:hypothetical protein
MSTSSNIRVPHVIGKRCNWCSKFYPPHRCHTLQTNAVICENCIDWHYNAHAFLGGAPPAGCQVCNATWEELRARDPQSLAVKIYVVQKDNNLQMLCEECISPYTDKRADLYRGTEYGKEKKAA